ncbi:cytochrome oxidase c assembly domain-containing protein [Purpureocillium lavendulum]|uniref:Cytochrome oxidase c assembly domain-containing protein n=1 Tax=Purpureocillium lavendulum TaxID=1247861 RepID=A0AB34FM83_9HYPO|nr:cytochrome oxidase c assembly domain-containing protein [Purpureocillium lavendulum]
MWTETTSRHCRIAIIGAGQVGGAVAYSLILQSLASELLLVDEDIERRDGQVSDLSDVSYGHNSHTKVRSATHREAGQCDIAIITAGSKYTLGQTTVEQIHRNAFIVRNVIDAMVPFKSDGILIVVSNPVDLLTSLAQKLSGLPASQVMGSGTFLDSIRLRGLASDKLEVSANSIGVYVLGVEGDSQVVAWSAATIGSMPIHESSPPSESLSRLELETACKERSKEIIRAKGSCPFGLASVVCSICSSIILDKRNTNTPMLARRMASKLSLGSTVKLNSGYELPLLGFGVYQTPKEQATEVCKEALKIGYRHIDSASAYRNQGPSAASIPASGIPRSDIFFTTKVPVREYPLGYDNAHKLVDIALSETGLDYLDLVLIHSPYGGPENRKGAWRALVEAVEAGKVRSIGVSNYGVHHLEELEAYIGELEAQRGGKGKGGVLSVGQWEVHPWLTRPDIVEWCRARNVAVEAYCPIVRGERFEEPKVRALADKYGKTPAQVLLRWSLQRGLVPLVKSVTPSRIAENAGAFDFELTDAEIEDLATKDYSPSHPPLSDVLSRHTASEAKMPSVQRTFTVLQPLAGGPPPDAPPPRPMTSKQVRAAHKAATRVPRLPRAERIRQEKEEQERIRKELDKERASSRARAARQRKRDKEDAERQTKKRNGLPLVTVRPSQDTIAKFVRGNGTSKKRDVTGEPLVANNVPDAATEEVADEPLDPIAEETVENLVDAGLEVQEQELDLIPEEDELDLEMLEHLENMTRVALPAAKEAATARAPTHYEVDLGLRPSTPIEPPEPELEPEPEPEPEPAGPPVCRSEEKEPSPTPSPSPPRQQPPPLSTQAILCNYDDYFPSSSQQARELLEDDLADTPFHSHLRQPSSSVVLGAVDRDVADAAVATPSPCAAAPKRFFSASGSNELYSLALHRSRRDAALDTIRRRESEPQALHTSRPVLQQQQQHKKRPRNHQTPEPQHHHQPRPHHHRPPPGNAKPATKTFSSYADKENAPPPDEHRPKNTNMGASVAVIGAAPAASQETEYGGDWVDEIALELTI